MKNFARKYRPPTFSEVVGQEHAVKTLLNSIREGRISHSYAFTGPRGIGKTTLARIIAKSVNCLNSQDGEPCNSCSVCMEIDNSRSVDVLEIDGASYTDVESIREIQDIIRYAPVKGKYRVIIIDEFHMLSKSAFNALLKTIEEPPDHVIFIFATTDPEKVPDTVMSRCQRYDLRKIPLRMIVDKLKEVAEKENLNIKDEAVYLIAREAEGSMRDGISLLEQVTSYSKGEVSGEIVEKILGISPFNLVIDILKSVSDKDINGVVEMLDRIFSQGVDPVRLARDTIEGVRHLIILKGVSEPEKFIERDKESQKRMKEIAGKFSTEELLNAYKILNNLYEEIIHSPLPDYSFEVGLIKLCTLPKLDFLKDLIEKLSGGQGQNSPSTEKIDINSEIKRPVKIQTEPAEIRKEDIKEKKEESNPAKEKVSEIKKNEEIANFEKLIVAHLSKKSKVTSELLANDLLETEVEENEVILKVKEDSPLLDKSFASSRTKLIEEAISSAIGHKVHLRFVPASHGKTDFQRDVEKKIRDDPILKKFLELFDVKMLNINVKSESQQ